jgi:hypothetical protein
MPTGPSSEPVSAQRATALSRWVNEGGAREAAPLPAERSRTPRAAVAGRPGPLAAKPSAPRARGRGTLHLTRRS